MRKRIFIHVLAIVILASIHVAEAQQTGKVYRIGYLSQTSSSTALRNIGPFRESLRELGYVEGKNFVLEFRHADGKRDRLPGLAAQLVRAKVDVIVVAGTRAIKAIKKATSTIPIIAGAAGDLVGPGLVASLARPGGNLTGSTRLATQLGGKRIEVLKEAVSKISRVAVIWSTRQDGNELREIERAARHLGVKIQAVKIKDPNKFQSAYMAMIKERADALIILHSGFAYTHRKQLLELAEENQLPSMCEQAKWTKAGCLISYGPDVPYLYRRTAIYVDKILKGTKPADLPVEQPTKFELIINLKMAKKLGLTIPPQFLAVANKVIK
jgi:putative ABC transport system substrate-binding protein